MRLAEIDAGVVRNVIEVADDQPRPDWCADWPEMGDAGGVGWLWDGTTFTAPAEAAPDLAGMRAGMTLTRRQVIIGMVSEGLISETEGIALAATGAAPAAVDAMIATMPADQQAAARITLAAFTVAYRLDPMTALFQQAGGMTDEQMDAFFTAYAAV